MKSYIKIFIVSGFLACLVSCGKEDPTAYQTKTIAPGYIAEVHKAGIQENCQGPETGQGIEAVACTINMSMKDNIHYCTIYATNELDEAHEVQHCLGMKHGAWYVLNQSWICVLVKESGKTNWKAGDLMCRSSDQHFYRKETNGLMTRML